MRLVLIERFDHFGEALHRAQQLFGRRPRGEFTPEQERQHTRAHQHQGDDQRQLAEHAARQRRPHGAASGGTNT